MNKFVFLLTALLLLFVFTSCSKQQNTNNKTDSKIENKIPQQKFDLDFTKMNFNFASGIMFDFLLQPEVYVGKSVLIKGQYHSEVYENQRIFAVFIWDATGCCPQSLSFIPPESFTFPDNFPREKDEITLFGTLQMVPFGDGEELYLITEDLIF